jgi:hypothetical protein
MITFFVAGCGDSSNNNSSPDMAMSIPDLAVSKGPDMAFHSLCGKPGDVGNSKGVGKYCTKLDDCATNGMATLCSTLGNDPQHPENDTFFCLFTCTASSPSGYCGENAACQCQGGDCGCTPTACGVGMTG